MLRKEKKNFYASETAGRKRCTDYGNKGYIRAKPQVKRLKTRENPHPARMAAESGGFEPPMRDRRIPVFKTGSFGRSDNSPTPEAYHKILV